MKIKFSRHSKRRMSLYNISEQSIKEILASEDFSIKIEDRIEIIKNVDHIKYPLKIVAKVEKDSIIIITAYPLKRGAR